MPILQNRKPKNDLHQPRQKQKHENTQKATMRQMRKMTTPIIIFSRNEFIHFRKTTDTNKYIMQISTKIIEGEILLTRENMQDINKRINEITMTEEI
jgi:hypothetical protein